MNKKIKKEAHKIVELGLDQIASHFGYSVVKSVLAVRDFVSKVREERLNENLKAFFLEAQSVNESQKVKFHKALGKDLDKFYKQLILTLEELDDQRKATIVGKLFKALIYKRYDALKFRKLAMAISNVMYEDLAFFKKIFLEFDTTKRTDFFLRTYSKADDEYQDVFTALESNGLIFKSEEGKMITIRERYITHIGELLRDNGFD